MSDGGFLSDTGQPSSEKLAESALSVQPENLNPESVLANSETGSSEPVSAEAGTDFFVQEPGSEESLPPLTANEDETAQAERTAEQEIAHVEAQEPEPMLAAAEEGKLDLPPGEPERLMKEMAEEKSPLQVEVERILEDGLETYYSHLTEKERFLFLETEGMAVKQILEAIYHKKNGKREKVILESVTRWFKSLPRTSIPFLDGETKRKAKAVFDYAQAVETAPEALA
ncbi:MAG TPA: hypothetical protein VFQ60_02995 [Patescibacteria group bacterium]|nr:hypothetical protein [Patescibacteria group bacterium]